MRYNNNPSGGVVTLERIPRPEDCPTTSTYAIRWRYESGSPSPHNGGFIDYIMSRANAVFVHRLIAKVPEGISVNFYHNSIGAGYSEEWLTDSVGTGKYEEYIYIIRCGSTGSFGSFGHVAFAGGTPPYDVIIAYSGIYDMTDAPTIYRDLETLDAYAKEARKVADAAKQRAEDTYTKAQADGVITSAERRAITRAEQEATKARQYAKDLVGIKDTRDHNQPPRWYMDNYYYQEVKEFKRTRAIGIPARMTGHTYCVLKTIVPWADASGGRPTQVATTQDGKEFRRRAVNDDRWGDWADIQAEVTDIKSGLTNANTLIQTLQTAQDLLEKKMLTESDLPDIQWLLDAFRKGNAQSFGIVLSKMIALSNQVDRITAYLSGYDGEGDGKILRAGIKYDDGHTETREVVDKEYNLSFLDEMEKAWMTSPDAAKTKYREEYGEDAPDFRSLADMSGRQYDIWAKQSTGKRMRWFLERQTLTPYERKSRYFLTKVGKVSEWRITCADVRTETVTIPAGDTGEEHTYIKHNGEAKFGAWTIIQEGIYNTPDKARGEHRVRLDAQAGELSIRGTGPTNEAVVVSKDGIFSNRAESGIYSSSLGLINGAAVAGSLQLQNSKAAVRPTYESLKDEEAMERPLMPFYAGVAGITAHYGEPGVYRNYGGWFDSIMMGGVHLRTTILSDTTYQKVFTLNASDAYVLILDCNDPYVDLPPAESVYPGWTVQISWDKIRGNNIRFRQSAGDHNIILSPGKSGESVAVGCTNGGTIRFVRLPRQYARYGQNIAWWAEEYRLWGQNA